MTEDVEGETDLVGEIRAVRPELLRLPWTVSSSTLRDLRIHGRHGQVDEHDPTRPESVKYLQIRNGIPMSKICRRSDIHVPLTKPVMSLISNSLGTSSHATVEDVPSYDAVRRANTDLTKLPNPYCRRIRSLAP